MTGKEVRQKYLDFFKESPRNHKEIPSASLVPENDPTTLFVGSGMQPLIPYLLGEAHPLGTKLVNSQKSFRAQDIEEIGDNRHTTFFEMLGNWSLGDPARNASHSDAGGYFKKEQLPWFFEFLTKVLGLNPKRLYVSVFEGNEIVPKDTESIEIWKGIFRNVGIEAKEGERIFSYGVEKNWWSRSGVPDRMPPGEPGGPDSEVFFEFSSLKHDPKFGEKCHPNCDCGRFLEIGNSVFMQYQKQSDGSFQELPQKNVDFGGGLERLVAVSENRSDIFSVDLYQPLIKEIEKMTDKSYKDAVNKPSMRIIVDHIKAATFLIADGIMPSNKEQGYVARRLLRRAAVKMHFLMGGFEPRPDFSAIVESVKAMYQGIYFDNNTGEGKIEEIIDEEMNKFAKSLGKGLKILESIQKADAKVAFDLYQSYGFPLEITKEILQIKGQRIDEEEFRREFEIHKNLSRSTSSGMFRGGLADHSEQVVKLHTATHLLQQALREVLGKHVRQKGSHITAERLRFDFTHPKQLKVEEVEKVVKVVNEQIQKDLKVDMKILPLKDAISNGALYVEGEKYPEKVKVYSVGNFSKEICGGPHVVSTKALGYFKIFKEESLGSGIRRIYATVK
ncbi:alanine--tRNA ligase [Candidatus Gottesmanbacteria bacterium]|nr:alanine--tRNA ligase [Candidatus Gottesmanbacteria bacterium]